MNRFEAGIGQAITNVWTLHSHVRLGRTRRHLSADGRCATVEPAAVLCRRIVGPIADATEQGTAEQKPIDLGRLGIQR
jgi:hypothetical protein